jgi:hypothetical protein
MKPSRINTQFREVEDSVALIKRYMAPSIEALSGGSNYFYLFNKYHIIGCFATIVGDKIREGRPNEV